MGLIQKFLVDIERLDTKATDTAHGYDPILGGLIPTDDGTQEGASRRVEHAVDTLTCQVDRANWGEQRIDAGGQQEAVDIVLVLDRRELASKGLLRTDGRPRFNAGDKVLRIKTRDGVTQEEFPDPPGMIVNRVERTGFGLRAFGAPRFNLVTLFCAAPRMS